MIKRVGWYRGKSEKGQGRILIFINQSHSIFIFVYRHFSYKVLYEFLVGKNLAVFKVTHYK